jgi:hypothetical protein
VRWSGMDKFLPSRRASSEVFSVFLTSLGLDIPRIPTTSSALSSTTTTTSWTLTIINKNTSSSISVRLLVINNLLVVVRTHLLIHPLINSIHFYI